MAKNNRSKEGGRVGALSKLDLHPRTRNWIAGVALSALAILMILSLLGIAGPAGAFIGRALRLGFGVGAWLLPIFAIVVAATIFRADREMMKPAVVGGILIFVSLLAILDIASSEASRRGGYVGYVLALPIVRPFGQITASFLFLAVGAIGVFILFNYPADRPSLRIRIGGRGEKSFPKLRSEGPLDRSDARESVTAPPEFKVRPLRSDRSEGEERKKEEPPSSRETFSVSSQPLPSITVPYTPPPLELFDRDEGAPRAGDIRANMAIIKRTFANFGIAVEMGEVTVGPTVTQYTLKPAEGVKLSQISSLANDLALALAAHPIRIEAPIPGRSLVGIEVPNEQVSLVRLRNLFSEREFRDSPYRLTFALGRDVAGAPVFAALEKMPHLLIAGATGAGKTIALNAIIAALLYRNPPSLLRLLLIDPKRVEFPVYNGIPHLLTPVVVDIEKTIHALRWVVSEMDRRFDVLSEARARDITVYNRERGLRGEPMPYLVVIVDELADIMASRGRDAEAAIVRIAQMARAVGIHLIVATQRPSVEVITGLIKANITSRMAFQVASQVDSRTIIDGAGAEKLLGNGDMLFLSAETSKPRRIQGAYVSEREVKRLAEFLSRSAEPSYEEGVTEPREGEEGEWIGEESGFGGDDPLYEEAKRLVIQMRKASASYLQRKLRIGYARAARLIDMLEERGVVGPGEGAKPREVLIGLDGKRVESFDGEAEEEGGEWEKS
jgi:S-DNA-T family DNA segregation ATPase FtsK/SpoIIIE